MFVFAPFGVARHLFWLFVRKDRLRRSSSKTVDNVRFMGRATHSITKTREASKRAFKRSHAFLPSGIHVGPPFKRVGQTMLPLHVLAPAYREPVTAGHARTHAMAWHLDTTMRKPRWQVIIRGPPQKGISARMVRMLSFFIRQRNHTHTPSFSHEAFNTAGPSKIPSVKKHALLPGQGQCGQTPYVEQPHVCS